MLGLSDVHVDNRNIQTRKYLPRTSYTENNRIPRRYYETKNQRNDINPKYNYSQNRNNVFSDEERWNNNIRDTQYFDYGHGLRDVNHFHDTDIKYKREESPQDKLKWVLSSLIRELY